MSEENVDVIRRAVALANAGDIEAAVELYHPDAELRDLQPAPGIPEVLRGREAIVASLKQWMEALDDWKIEVHEYVDAHPWVVCDTQWRATAKGTDVPIDWRVADAHEVKDGKVVRELYGYPNVAAALQAVRVAQAAT
jgi:ketosteroid isomerase-like protein